MNERDAAKLLEPIFKAFENRLVQLGLVLLLLVGFLWVGSSGSTRTDRPMAAAGAADGITPAAAKAPSAATDYAPFTLEQLCKAAIAVLMDRDPASMRALRDGEIVRNSYVRPGDQSVWSQRCRFDGARIIWASDTGRWRTHPEDERLTFKVFQGKEATLLHISETFSDGSETTRNFTLQELGE